MISKERLDQLIQDETIIYDASSKKYISRLQLNKLMWIDDNYLCFDRTEYPEIASVDCIFETHEEAEWYLQFGDITRTETLNLPTWEKIQKRLEADTSFNVYSFDEILMFVSDMRIIINNYGYKKLVKVYDEKLTKENYIKACEICKKLFLGEEV